MIEVVTVLKNQEDFNRRVSGSSGSYHGLFATHPRNDTRLQEAIAAVGQLEETDATLKDNPVLRERLDGLVVGESAGSRQQDERNRYYQTLLGYTQVSDEWSVSETTTTVTAANQGVAELRVEARRLSKNNSPCLSRKNRISDLQN